MLGVLKIIALGLSIVEAKFRSRFPFVLAAQIALISCSS